MLSYGLCQELQHAPHYALGGLSDCARCMQDWQNWDCSAPACCRCTKLRLLHGGTRHTLHGSWLRAVVEVCLVRAADGCPSQSVARCVVISQGEHHGVITETAVLFRFFFYQPDSFYASLPL
eukprot:g23488.t1